MDKQYRYRKLIPMTWEQYLDEPLDVVDWTLHIAAIDPANQQRPQGQPEA
jgi:hypothetical protein